LEGNAIVSIFSQKDTLWLSTYYNTGVIKFNTINNNWTIYNSSNSGLLPGRGHRGIIDNKGDKYFSTGDLHTEGGVSSLRNNSWQSTQEKALLI